MAIGESTILCCGTALIGATLIVHGIGMYVGGFPGLISVDKYVWSTSLIGYIAGLVVLAILGSIVQMR